MSTVPAHMHVMALPGPRLPLVQAEREMPRPGRFQVLVQVRACGVCRTDLHVVDDELPGIRHPIVPGHEVVGEVVDRGPDVSLDLGARVGVPWLGWTCGHCDFCRIGQENLCGEARFTGWQLDGGYADYLIADARYCLPLPGKLDDAHAAPLLCAGLIGYRALRMAGDARRLGVYGFGAAAHIVAQVARFEGRDCYAFVRPGDADASRFATQLGCRWAGGSDERPPVELDAAIIFAPAGTLVPAALAVVRRGGTVVCGGIHMSDIPSFPYALLWGERTLRSVANLTRRDGLEFLALAPRVPIRTEVTTFALAEANEALRRLRDGRLTGAAVLLPGA
jgi:propanol-preferring alcohol dehydrogenase